MSFKDFTQAMAGKTPVRSINAEEDLEGKRVKRRKYQGFRSDARSWQSQTWKMFINDCENTPPIKIFR